MDTFNYISVMISIVIGLGIANILNSIGILVRNRSRVDHSTNYYLHLFFVILLLFQSWWTIFGYRDYPDWDFFFYLLILVESSLIYLLTEMLRIKDELEITPLETTFTANKSPYFLILLTSAAIGAILQSIVTNNSIFTEINIFRALIILVCIAGVFSKERIMHRLIAIALLAVYFTLIVFYRLDIGALLNN